MEFQGPYFLNTLPMNLLTFAVHAPPYSPPGAAGGRLKLDGWLFNEIIAYFNEIIAYFHEVMTYFDELIAPVGPPLKRWI